MPGRLKRRAVEMPGNLGHPSQFFYRRGFANLFYREKPQQCGGNPAGAIASRGRGSSSLFAYLNTRARAGMKLLDFVRRCTVQR